MGAELQLSGCHHGIDPQNVSVKALFSLLLSTVKKSNPRRMDEKPERKYRKLVGNRHISKLMFVTILGEIYSPC